MSSWAILQIKSLANEVRELFKSKNKLEKENNKLKAEINQLKKIRLLTDAYNIVDPQINESEKALNISSEMMAVNQEKRKMLEEAVNELQQENKQLKHTLEQSQQYRIHNTQEWNDLQDENKKLNEKISDLKDQLSYSKKLNKMNSAQRYLDIAGTLLERCKKNHSDCSFNWYAGISKQIELSRDFYLEVKQENEELKAEVEELEMSIGRNCRRYAIEKEKLNNQISDIQTHGITLAGGTFRCEIAGVASWGPPNTPLSQEKQCKFKVGDRVMTFHGKGIITKIHSSVSLIVRLDNGNRATIYSTHLVKKLKKKRPKFKVGDRVTFSLAGKFKGAVIEVENRGYPNSIITVKVDHDHRIFRIFSSDCKRLVRKPKFKVEDKVNYYHFNKCLKATVVNTFNQDNGFIKIITHKGGFVFEASVKDCKRLIRKKPKFNIGDRVKGVLSKGTVTATINDRTKVVQVKFDDGDTLFYIVSQESIRKLKRKAKKCSDPSRYEADDTIYIDDLDALLASIEGAPIKCKECINGKQFITAVHERYQYPVQQIDCPKCKGTGWFHWNNDIP